MSKERQRPQEGGSFVKQKNGKLKREQFTRQPHDPEHERNKRPETKPQVSEPPATNAD